MIGSGSHVTNGHIFLPRHAARIDEWLMCYVSAVQIRRATIYYLCSLFVADID
jgi:hypothetical protein